VLVDGATVPSKEALPTPLEALAGRQAIEISNTRYQFDLERLVTAVSRALGEPVQSKVEDRIIQPVRSRASFGTAFSWWLTKTKEHPVVAAGILLVLVLSGVSQLVLNFSEAIRIPTGSVLLESTRRQVTRPDEIAGIWHHDIYGDIQLKKAGDRITGGYAYPRQIGFIYGDLQGEREGRRLDVTWCQDTTKDVPCANRKWQGDGYFILSPDGDRLEGKWRYSGQQEWMGDWLFTRK
jgi:hypothetical protein